MKTLPVFYVPYAFYLALALGCQPKKLDKEDEAKAKEETGAVAIISAADGLTGNKIENVVLGGDEHVYFHTDKEIVKVIDPTSEQVEIYPIGVEGYTNGDLAISLDGDLILAGRSSVLYIPKGSSAEAKQIDRDELGISFLWAAEVDNKHLYLGDENGLFRLNLPTLASVQMSTKIFRTDLAVNYDVQSVSTSGDGTVALCFSYNLTTPDTIPADGIMRGIAISADHGDTFSIKEMINGSTLEKRCYVHAGLDGRTYINSDGGIYSTIDNASFTYVSGKTDFQSLFVDANSVLYVHNSDESTILRSTDGTQWERVVLNHGGSEEKLSSVLVHGGYRYYGGQSGLFILPD